jgi:hypothetical protein
VEWAGAHDSEELLEVGISSVMMAVYLEGLIKILSLQRRRASPHDQQMSCFVVLKSQYDLGWHLVSDMFFGDRRVGAGECSASVGANVDFADPTSAFRLVREVTGPKLTAPSGNSRV